MLGGWPLLSALTCFPPGVHPIGDTCRSEVWVIVGHYFPHLPPVPQSLHARSWFQHRLQFSTDPALSRWIFQSCDSHWIWRYFSFPLSLEKGTLSTIALLWMSRYLHWLHSFAPCTQPLLMNNLPLQPLSAPSLYTRTPSYSASSFHPMHIYQASTEVISRKKSGSSNFQFKRGVKR